mgnify:CR=1 FL=1
MAEAWRVVHRCTRTVASKPKHRAIHLAGRGVLAGPAALFVVGERAVIGALVGEGAVVNL